MKLFVRILLFIFAIWLINHPNTKALFKGISSSMVEAPVEKAKADFRSNAEKHAKQEAEARMKEIDASIDAADRGETSSSNP